MTYTRPRSPGEAALSRHRRSHKISATDRGVFPVYDGRERVGTVVPVRVETIDAAGRRHFLDQCNGRVPRCGGCREALRALSRLERAS